MPVRSLDHPAVLPPYESTLVDIETTGRATAQASRVSADHLQADVDRSGAGAAAAGLIVLATVAILEGYRWLDLIRLDAPRPTMVLYVVLVTPATFFLTRRTAVGRAGRSARLCARAASLCVVGLGIAALWVAPDITVRLLGAASLLLAAAALILAWTTEFAGR